MSFTLPGPDPQADGTVTLLDGKLSSPIDTATKFGRLESAASYGGSSGVDAMTSDAVNRIRQATRVEGASGLVAMYFDPASPFAGSTFHACLPSKLATLHPADLLTAPDLGTPPSSPGPGRLLDEHEPKEFIQWSALKSRRPRRSSVL